jgi:hypothetical protein
VSVLDGEKALSNTALAYEARRLLPHDWVLSRINRLESTEKILEPGSNLIKCSICGKYELSVYGHVCEKTF